MNDIKLTNQESPGGHIELGRQAVASPKILDLLIKYGD